MYKILVYVSGCMTPNDVCPSFDDNLRRLERVSRDLFLLGYAVYCPYERWFDEDEQITAELKREPYGDMYRKVIAMDLCILKRCDIIVMTKHWRWSKGAQIEYDFALQNDITIWEFNQ